MKYYEVWFFYLFSFIFVGMYEVFFIELLYNVKEYIFNVVFEIIVYFFDVEKYLCEKMLELVLGTKE